MNRKLSREEAKMLNQQAKQVLDPWWEGQHPRPVASYIGVLQIVKRCLQAGYEPDQIRCALDDTLVLTVNGIEFALRKQQSEKTKVPERSHVPPMVGSAAASYCEECGVRGGRHRWDCDTAIIETQAAANEEA